MHRIMAREPDLDLGVSVEELARAGRRPAAVEEEVVGSISAEELVMLASRGGTVSEAPVLQRVTERHHKLARLLSLGLSEGDAAIATGFSLGRVSVLKASPAFKELLELYRDRVDEEFADFAEQLAGLSKDTILTIRERLEDAPDEFSNSQLLEMLKTTADRTGHGPSQRIENNINISLSEKLEAARRRAREAALPQMRDITPDE